MLRYDRLNCLLATLLAMALISGCIVTQVRKGQDYFSQAAAIENKAIFSSLALDSPDAGPSDAMAALTCYRLAEASLESELAKEAESLKQSGLYGTTYVLLAMTQWRIAALEGNRLTTGERPSGIKMTSKKRTRRQMLLERINTINQHKHEWTLGTRDKVLSHALYGFYDHDGGQMAPEYDRAKKWFKSALNRFDEAVKNNDVPPNHSIRVYIAMAKLRTLASWLFASQSSGLTPEGDIKDVREINTHAKTTICSIEPFYRSESRLSNRIETKLDYLLATIGLSMPTKSSCQSIQN